MVFPLSYYTDLLKQESLVITKFFKNKASHKSKPKAKCYNLFDKCNAPNYLSTQSSIWNATWQGTENVFFYSSDNNKSLEKSYSLQKSYFFIFF